MRVLHAVLLAMLGGVGLLAAVGARADAPSGYPFKRYDEALREAAAQDKRVFVYFGRYGCGFCDKTNRESFVDGAVRQRYTQHYVLAYVDAESDRRLTLPSGERITEFELGARLKALVTPLFLYLEPDGKLIVKVPGFQSAQDFLRYDSFVHQGHYRRQSLNEFLAAEAR